MQLVLIWTLMWAALDTGYWICLLLAVPAAGFLVRLGHLEELVKELHEEVRLATQSIKKNGG